MRHFISKAFAAVAACALAMGSMSYAANYGDKFQTRIPGLEKQWKKAASQSSWAARTAQPGFKFPSPQKLVQAPDSEMPLSDSFGPLYMPDGKEWTYRATYEITEDGYSYASATFYIYDENLEQVAEFTDHLTLGEGETSINYVVLNPNVTRKFFHYNDAYEMMVFVHTTTEDYTGNYYTHVFSLGTPDPILTMDGNQVLLTSVSNDIWSEEYIMVFMTEDFSMEEPEEEGALPNYTYIQHYNVYKKCGWGTGGPELLHTFDIDYQTISGSGENMLPVIPAKHNGKMYYVLPHYQTPYFDPSVGIMDEPVILPDNKFIIDLYDENFEIIKTTTIPMEVPDGFLYSFPEMGGFFYTNDVQFDHFSPIEGMPAYIVTYENYVNANDDFVSTYVVYDVEGNIIDVIGQNVFDTLQLSDIPGQQPQFCFLQADEEAFQMVDLYSCDVVAEIPLVVKGYTLSTNIDRVLSAGSYQYAIGLLNGELASDNETVMQRIAYFDNDGEFSHWEDIMMSKDVVMAQPYIYSEALNPYLYNSDEVREYMILVKELIDPGNSSASNERLYVINGLGEKILAFGPDEEKGVLSSIWLQGLGTDRPMLAVAYRDDDWRFTVTHTALPLYKELQGAGTQQDPYLIKSAGDMQLIDKYPAAYYKMVADINFSGMVWHGTQKPFAGTFDGNGHAMFNLTLDGIGLFSSLEGSAVVKDITIVEPIVSPGKFECGIITGSTVYNGSKAPTISGITVFSPTAISNEFNNDFGIIAGSISTTTAITDCAVYDANIYLPHAEAGGIVGRQLSGAYVANCYVSGTLEAHAAGGIVASCESAAVAVSNCHVNAEIIGYRGVGGIAAFLDQERGYRPTVKNCYVEGTLTAKADNDPSIGGIAGYLAQCIYTDEENSITGCVVAVSEINYNTNATVATAHRIAGHTVDVDKVVDWENVQPGMEPDEYPLLNVHEANITNNYAIGIALIDDTYADDPNSIEGKTVEQISQDFLAGIGFAFGSDSAAPWKMAGTPVLYLEGAEQPATPDEWWVAGISTPTIEASAVKIRYAGQTVSCSDAHLAIYNLNGMKIASGFGALSTEDLPKGIYIVVAQSARGTATLKIAR